MLQKLSFFLGSSARQKRAELNFSVFSTRDLPQIYYILGKFELTKNLVQIFKKIVQTLWMYSSTPFKTFPNTLSMLKTSISWFRRPRKFVKPKKMAFLLIFRNPWFWFVNKEIVVDQVLTKLFQIDPKLTLMFLIFWMMVVSLKLKKIFDDLDPPQKMTFFGEGSGSLDVVNFGYVSGRVKLIVSKIAYKNL